MLYIEMPAGVGYSYAEDKSEYYFDDHITSADNLKALLVWFKDLFP